MMIMVCPYSFGFSSSWVTDCDTPVARSEFVTEVGTTRAALRRLLDHAAPLMGVRYSLPQYGRIRSHHPALAKAKKNEQTGPFISSGYAEPAVAQWVDVHLRLIQPPRGRTLERRSLRGRFFLWHLGDEKPRPAEHRTGLSQPPERVGPDTQRGPDKGWLGRVNRPSPAASWIEAAGRQGHREAVRRPHWQGRAIPKENYRG